MAEMKDLDKGVVLRHYKRKDVQDAIIGCAEDKEVVGSFGGKGYAKRPDILVNPGDILELVKQGITSFHSSEETWRNALQIDPNLKKQDVDKIRKGWDLVLDIDCKFLEYSKISGDLIVKALKHHGITSISAKFSGNHGFHIAVPFEAFPLEVNGKETRLMFPDAPRSIAGYLSQMIKKHLSRSLLENASVALLASRFDVSEDDLMTSGEFDPFKVVDIDTILISSRHLFRMPYSFNEKSGLVSVPIDPEKILEFDKKMAEPDNVVVNDYVFLDRSSVASGEGRKLLVQALDSHVDLSRGTNTYTNDSVDKKYDEFSGEAVPVDLFPPCVKLILNGIKDGKKRSVFVLINFLTSVGWDYDAIENLLREWNAKNDEPLREVNYLGQLRYHKQNKKRVLPPNCTNDMYYKGIGVCKPDSFCSRIKNPVSYARKKAFLVNNATKTVDRTLTEEEKEKRRRVREDRKKFREEVARRKEAGEVVEEVYDPSSDL